MEELKPCPFCGGEAHFIKVKHVVGVWYTVCCDDAECIGHEQSRFYTLRRLAAEAWNRRAIDRDELLKVADMLDCNGECSECECWTGTFCKASTIVAARIRKALGVER